MGPGQPDNDDKPLLPVEIEVYINADGSVTFADLEEGAVSLARELDPEGSQVRDNPEREDIDDEQDLAT